MKEIICILFGMGLGFYIKSLRDKNKANVEAAVVCTCANCTKAAEAARAAA